MLVPDRMSVLPRLGTRQRLQEGSQRAPMAPPIEWTNASLLVPKRKQTAAFCMQTAVSTVRRIRAIETKRLLIF
jgi:hypothetical protein